jgi:uncharacterized protein YndB with AHSA1/START domain
MMTKFTFACLVYVLSLPVCAQPDNPEAINWPATYEPAKSRFYVHNEIEINAPPEKVWSFLIDALAWESWYKGARNVSFSDPTDAVLNAGSVFSWETMGLRFESTVRQFEPNRLLAWESKKKSIQGFHVWLIVPTDKGCKVITDESQNGWLTFFEKTFQGKKLQKLHDVWLWELKTKAEDILADYDALH